MKFIFFIIQLAWTIGVAGAAGSAGIDHSAVPAPRPQSLASRAGPAKLSSSYTGLVFEDSNSNALCDAGERGLSGIRVSDGLSIVQTDSAGRYEIAARSNPPPRFIVIAKPSRYRCVNGFYRRLTNASPQECNFALAPEASTNRTFAFIQIGDSETAETNDIWFTEISAAIARQPVSFIAHTGDLCGRRGIEAHSESLPRLGLPFYCVAGNHDYIATVEPYKSWEDYDPTLERSEEYFERFMGPTHYSFEYGDVLFIVLSGRGDGTPSPEMPDIQLAWLKNELALIPSNTPLVVFQHIPPVPLSNDLKIVNRQGESLNLSDHNLKALITGHWHDQAAVSNRTGLTITTAPPNRGGIDFSPRGFRLFEFDGDRLRVATLLGGLKHKMTIISPSEECFPGPAPEMGFDIQVNAYDSQAPVREAWYRWGDAGAWQPLQRRGDWGWVARESYRSAFSNAMTLTVRVDFEDQSRVGSKVVHFNTGATAPSTGQTNGLLPPLRLAWSSPAGKAIGFSAPVIAGGKVYIGTLDDDNAAEQAITALDLKTGQRVWTFRPDSSIKHTMAVEKSSGSVIFGPSNNHTVAVENGLVFAQSHAGTLYALDMEIGALRWRNTDCAANTCCGHYGAAALHQRRLILPANKGLMCLQAQTGRELWVNPALRLCNNGYDAIFSCVPNDKVFYVGHNRATGNLSAVDEVTGRILWTTNQAVATGPAVLGQRLYLTAYSSLLALNALTGAVITNRTLTDFQTGSTPLVVGNTIVVGTATNGLCAFDTETLAMTWDFQTGPALLASAPYRRDGYRTVHSSPIQVGALIYFGGMDGWLYALDAGTGALRWKFDLGVPLFGAPAAAGDRLLIAGFDGNVYAFEGAAGESRMNANDSR